MRNYAQSIDTNRKYKSLGYYIMSKGLLIVIPVLAILIFISMAFIRMNMDNIKKSYQDTLTLYTDRMDSELNSAERFLKNITANNDYFSALQSSDKSEQLLALINLNNYIKKNSTLFNESIDFFFIYNPSDSYYASHYTSNSDDKIALMDFIKGRYISNASNSLNELHNWNLVEAGSNAYFLRTIKTNDIYIGAIIFVDNILGKIKMSITQIDVYPAFIDPELNLYSLEQDLPDILPDGDNPQYCRGNDGKMYSVLYDDLAASDARCCFFIKNYFLLTKEASLLWAVVALTLISISLIPFLFLFISRSLIKPIYSLVNVMNEVRKANMDVRINERSSYIEFNTLYDAYNNMISQINQLQKSKLRFLQLQTNPHFVLNGLNAIHQQAVKEGNKRISDYSLMLIKHLRFMLNLTKDKTFIKNELEFVNNYIELQKQRLTYKVEYHTDIDPELLEQNIPPYLIHTFVENIFKYGLSEDNVFYIHISIHREDLHQLKQVIIQISDKGPGFRAEILNAISNSEEIVDTFGNIHIGIENVISRMRILYGNSAEIKTENMHPGSRITILLPYEQ